LIEGLGQKGGTKSSLLQAQKGEKETSFCKERSQSERMNYWLGGKGHCKLELRHAGGVTNLEIFLFRVNPG